MNNFANLLLYFQGQSVGITSQIKVNPTINMLDNDSGTMNLRLLLFSPSLNFVVLFYI